MSLGPLESLRQVAPFMDPRVGFRLFRAGAVTPRRAAAACGVVPWVLGRGPTLGIVSQINGKAEPGKAALHDRSGTLTWRELDRRTNQVANVLARRGVSAEDTVATLLLTCLVFLALGWTNPDPYFVTALSIGGIVCIAASNGGNNTAFDPTRFAANRTRFRAPTY